MIAPPLFRASLLSVLMAPSSVLTCGVKLVVRDLSAVEQP